jgi:hypothetical protein
MRRIALGAEQQQHDRRLVGQRSQQLGLAGWMDPTNVNLRTPALLVVLQPSVGNSGDGNQRLALQCLTIQDPPAFPSSSSSNLTVAKVRQHSQTVRQITSCASP